MKVKTIPRADAVKRMDEIEAEIDVLHGDGYNAYHHSVRKLQEESDLLEEFLEHEGLDEIPVQHRAAVGAIGGRFTMNTLYILGCGAQKRDVASPAGELYTGPLFRAALLHARRFASSDEIFVLSAKYGLLYLDDKIAPYDVRFSQLDPIARRNLKSAIRHRINRILGVQPLRYIVLAGADYVSLLREALQDSRLSSVPLRTPLAGLPIGKQRQWLFYSHGWQTKCEVELPETDCIGAAENERLRASVRAASLWWAGQLLHMAPPPEASLFADALALELWREWERIYRKSREWPEDIRFPVVFQNAPGGYLGNALRAIGLDECAWWKHEWGDRRLNAIMHFSMNAVFVTGPTGRLGAGDETETLVFLKQS